MTGWLIFYAALAGAVYLFSQRAYRQTHEEEAITERVTSVYATIRSYAADMSTQEIQRAARRLGDAPDPSRDALLCRYFESFHSMAEAKITRKATGLRCAGVFIIPCTNHLLYRDAEWPFVILSFPMAFFAMLGWISVSRHVTEWIHSKD